MQSRSQLITTSGDEDHSEAMVAHPIFSIIQEFHLEAEHVSAYLEHVFLYFAANDIDEGKWVPVFVNIVGATTYMLLCSIVAPELPPPEKAFDELVDVLKCHFESKLVVIVQQLTFHLWDQGWNESVTEYMVELRHLSAHCKFDAFLDQALCNHAPFLLSQERECVEKWARRTGKEGLEAMEQYAKSLKVVKESIWK